MIKNPTIVFMGTAGFAVPTLELLIKEGFKVVAVITAPDKPAGRGRKIRFSLVKESAIHHQLPVLQPINLKDSEFQNQLNKIKPDLQIVVAFRMLPESVWALPRLGTINLHASLLPQYRGAAPINHAIINGETETGVTTFMIDKEIDTGKILFKEKTPIQNNETAGELHDRLMIIGANLVCKTIREILSGKAEPIPQKGLIPNNGTIHKAPKIFREDCKTDWDAEGRKVFNFIRGLSPSPGAFTHLRLQNGNLLILKIYKVELGEAVGQKAPGSFITNKKTKLGIVTKNRIIYLKELQLQGKKRMLIDEFLRGFDTTAIVTFE